VSLCVIAMAVPGMLMLTGRLPLRRGAQVILGCFLLLGSTTLADGLLGLW
jgi:type IV secretory pathway VirB2 component (pilin)